MLEIRHLNASYGQAQVLFDVSMNVATGSLVLVQGLNGAGKSTLLKSIMGLMPDASGQISWHGQAFEKLAPHERSKKVWRCARRPSRVRSPAVRQIELTCPSSSKSDLHAE